MADFSTGTVTPVTLATSTVGSTIAVGTNAYAVAITPDGITACVEGVETSEQLAALRTLGCELAQGHLFAEPQPAALAGELRSWSLLAT